MKIKFEYDKNLIDTQKDIVISVADLRDLINASNLNPQDTKDEMYLILQSIMRKNRLQKNTFAVDFDLS